MRVHGWYSYHAREIKGRSLHPSPSPPPPGVNPRQQRASKGKGACFCRLSWHSCSVERKAGRPRSALRTQKSERVSRVKLKAVSRARWRLRPDYTRGRSAVLFLHRYDRTCCRQQGKKVDEGRGIGNLNYMYDSWDPSFSWGSVVGWWIGDL